MKNTNRPSLAISLCILTFILSLFFAPALRAQILLQEDFDDADLGTPPTGWGFSGQSGNVDPGQACSGNAFRMNQFQNATFNNLDTPDLPRGTAPGTVVVSFDMRLADWNDNTQLSGSGSAFAQLFIDGAFSQDFLSFSPASFTNGCLTQTASFSTAAIPLGVDFKLRFLGVWSSGDWSYVIDNVDIRVVNDECADAVLLPQTSIPTGGQGAERFVGSLAGATQSVAGCVGTANDDVWFQFVATERSAGITVVGGDIVVELFSGSCGSLTSLRCVDASNTNEIFSYYGLTVGETYYVRVYSFGSTPLTGTAADITIEIGTPKSVNNECPSAEMITQSSATSCGTNLTMGSLEDATESQAGCAGTANDDVWYEFVATSTDFTVFLQEDTDMVVQLFEGSCGSLTSLVCRDLSLVDEILHYEGATIGATYFLRVHSFGSTPLTGTDAEFGICVFTTAPAPDNNDCNDAITLAVDIDETCSTGEDGTTNGASRIATNPRCDGISGNRIVWYSFTAAASEHFVTLSDVDLLNGTDGARSSFEVFSGTCGALTRVHCSGQMFGANPGQRTVSGLTPGTTYLIRVIPVNPTDVIDFNICVTTACPDAPSDLAVNSITTTSASLTHSYPFGILRTHIVTLDGDDPITEAVFSQESIQTTASVTGLLPATDYDYYVLETCGGANNLVGPISFQTCALLATGLTVSNITATTASLIIDADSPAYERDFYVMPAGVVPVFGGPNPELVYFSSALSSEVIATGLSSNTTYDFYVGQTCPETFADPFTFTTRPSCGDIIYDTGGESGNYGNDEDYAVTICPETADQSGGARRVSITFDEFNTENGFDGITIYNGEDTNADVITSPGSDTNLWSWERTNNVGGGDLEGVTLFTTNVSGCITLRFTSDGSVTYPGFKATINCPETSEIFDQILIPVPAGSGAVVADRGYLSLASEHMYYVKDGVGSLLALKLGDTRAQVPFSGVSVVAGSGATNLGLNGCMAPYTNVPDWWTMNRTWDVVPTVDPAFPVEVRFLYTTEDFMAIENASGFMGITHENLSFYKINGGEEEDLTAPGNACHDLVSPANYQEFDPGEYIYLDLSDGAARNGHAAQFVVNSFSGGGGGAGTGFAGALPVDFLSFTGEAGPKHNHLNWTTAREGNTANHAVERSTDGVDWVTIGSLLAAGNSDQTIAYVYVDEQPLSTALYRIRTTDQDGSFTHSPIIQILRTQNGSERIGVAFPNPATNHVLLPYFAESVDESLQLDLLDAAGRRLSSQSVSTQNGRNDLRVSLQALPAGLYWLSLTDAGGQRHLRRVVKR